MLMKYKNGVLSAVFGVVQQLLTLIFGLIVPRLFIRTFGSEMNGLLSSLGNVYSYLALVEAGVGTAAIQALYGPLGRGDRDGINGIMSATAQYYNKAGFLYLLGVLAIAVIYPLTVPTTIPFWTVFILTLLSGAGGVINFWVQGKYMVLLQAEGKKYLMSIVSMFVYVAGNVMKIVLLLLGYDVIAIHIGYFVISLLQMAFYFVYMRRNYRWLDLRTEPDQQSLSQSGAVFVQQIMWMICSNTDILVLTYVAQDLKAVSVYTVYLMVFSAVEKLFSTLFGSFHYLLGQKYNTDKTAYLPLHKVYEGLSMYGSFALYTVAFVLITPFMKVYTAGITDTQYVDPYLPLLFTVMHLLSSSREASSRVINFAGHFRQMQWRAVAESAINLVVSVLLVLKLGIYGVLLGTIAAYLYRTNDIIIYANRVVLRRKCSNTYRMVAVNMCLFVAVSGVFRFFDLTVTGYVSFFVKGALCGGMICLIYLTGLCIFEKEAAAFLRSIMKKGINKTSEWRGVNR